MVPPMMMEIVAGLVTFFIGIQIFKLNVKILNAIPDKLLYAALALFLLIVFGFIPI
jgi:hypothetical protein